MAHFPRGEKIIRHFSMSHGGSKLTFWMFRSIVFNNPKVANIRIKSASLFALICAFEMEFIMLGQTKQLRRKCAKQIMSATRSLSGGKCHISCNRDHTRVVTERLFHKNFSRCCSACSTGDGGSGGGGDAKKRCCRDTQVGEVGACLESCSNLSQV